jgi:hypothetical protein
MNVLLYHTIVIYLLADDSLVIYSFFMAWLTYPLICCYRFIATDGSLFQARVYIYLYISTGSLVLGFSKKLNDYLSCFEFSAIHA